VTVEIFLACASISSFSFLAFSAATRLVCSNDLILRSLATTAFLRGSRKFLANPSFTSMRSPKWPTPSIVSCRMTFIPLTPSVGKEKRILEGLQKSQSPLRSDVPSRPSSTRFSWLDSHCRAPVLWPRTTVRGSMTARDLIERWVRQLPAEQTPLGALQSDHPLAPVTGRLLQTVGTLYLYEFRLPPDGRLPVDIPVSVVLDDMTEPAEGLVL